MEYLILRLLICSYFYCWDKMNNYDSKFVRVILVIGVIMFNIVLLVVICNFL